MRPIEDEEDQLLTPQKAAELLGIDPVTLRKHADNGHFSTTRTVGGHRRYSRDEIERFKREGLQRRGTLREKGEPIVDRPPAPKWVGQPIDPPQRPTPPAALIERRPE